MRSILHPPSSPLHFPLASSYSTANSAPSLLRYSTFSPHIQPTVIPYNHPSIAATTDESRSPNFDSTGKSSSQTNTMHRPVTDRHTAARTMRDSESSFQKSKFNQKYHSNSILRTSHSHFPSCTLSKPSHLPYSHVFMYWFFSSTYHPTYQPCPPSSSHPILVLTFDAR